MLSSSVWNPKALLIALRNSAALLKPERDRSNLDTYEAIEALLSWVVLQELITYRI